MEPTAVHGLTEQSLTFLWFVVGCFVLAVGVIAWMTKRIEDGCPACAHCANAKKLRADEQERLRQEYERRWGLRPLDDDEEGPKPQD